MSLDRIVDSIPVPLAVASSLVVEGEHTARDLAYALSAAYLAASRQEAEDGTPVAIPGNGLRYALARSRRDKDRIENGRVERMMLAKLRAGDIEAALPSMRAVDMGTGRLVLRSGLVVDGDRQQQWHVDRELADALRVREGTAAVDLPWTLLQGAKHKSSVPVMLRLLAWIAGAEPAWVKARENRWNADLFDGERLVLEIPVDQFMAAMPIPAGTKPSRAMERILGPAAEEIAGLTGYRVSFSEVRTRYRPNAAGSAREGRLLAIRVEIDIPVMPTRPSRPVARQPGKAWKPAPKWHKPPKPAVPAPAFVDNVEPFPDDEDDDEMPPTRPASPVPLPVRPSVVTGGGFATMRAKTAVSIKSDNARSPDLQTPVLPPTSRPPRRPAE